MYKCLHSHISIAGIAAETFANLKELTTLRLDNNLLSSFPVWELAANPALAGLSLANNLWSCKCDFLNHFLVFQKKIGAKIQDKAEIRCVTDHYLGEAVTPLDNVICADQPANSGKEEIFLSSENFHLQQSIFRLQIGEPGVSAGLHSHPGVGAGGRGPHSSW